MYASQAYQSNKKNPEKPRIGTGNIKFTHFFYKVIVVRQLAQKKWFYVQDEVAYYGLIM